MIVEFVRINSLDEIDFDYMFSESYSRMENTFLWPSPCVTYEQRKQHYYDLLIRGMNGTWRPAAEVGDKFIMIVTKVDGVIVEFAAGTKNIEGIVSLRWHLTTPGTDGKRNWRYSQEAYEARKAFIAQENITAFKEFTWKGSLHYRMLRMRAQTGNYILEERPNPHKHSTHELVEFIIRFP